MNEMHTMKNGPSKGDKKSESRAKAILNRLAQCEMFEGAKVEEFALSGQKAASAVEERRKDEMTYHTQRLNKKLL